MDSPLELPAPPESEPIRRIEHFARDLAYGSIHGFWDSIISAILLENGKVEDWTTDTRDRTILRKYIANKWNDAPPSPRLLMSFEYFDRIGQGVYALTSKAFALLQNPVTAPSVFISYKREYSSSLALLVEAKLKLRDSTIEVFIDKLIKPGDDWEQNIIQKIGQSRYFVCLLAPDSYTQSEWIRKELDWAFEAGCEIISVLHNGCELSDRYPVWLGKKQVIKVDFETAKHYESALDEIMVGLGYSTY